MSLDANVCGDSHGAGASPEPTPPPNLPGDRPPVPPAEPAPGQREPNGDPPPAPVKDPILPAGTPSDPLPQPYRSAF